MSFTAVGAILHGTGAFSITPANVGDLILMEVIQTTNNTVNCTALTSSNVTWTQLGSHLNGPTTGTASIFAGKVTSTSAATVTPTWSGTAPTSIFLAGQEFSVTSGSWSLNGQNSLNLSSGVNTWPSITPTVSNSLYWGYIFDTGSEVNGSTTGFVYGADANGNGVAYKLSCPAGTAAAPVWGDSGHEFGWAVVMSEPTSSTVATVTRANQARRPYWPRKGVPAVQRGAPFVPTIKQPPFPVQANKARRPYWPRRGVPSVQAGVPRTAPPPVIPQPPFPVQPNMARRPHWPRQGYGRVQPGAPFVKTIPQPPFPAQPNKARRPFYPRRGVPAVQAGAPVVPTIFQPPFPAKANYARRPYWPRRGSGQVQAGAPWSGAVTTAWVAGSQAPIAAGQTAGFSSWVMSPQGCDVVASINWFGNVFADIYQANYTDAYGVPSFGFISASTSATYWCPPMTPVFIQVPAIAAPAGSEFAQPQISVTNAPAPGTQLYFDHPRLSPAGFQVPYLNDNPGDLTITEDIQYLFNDIAVTRNADQVGIRVRNAASRTQYFPRVFTRTIFSSPDDPGALTDAANNLLNAFATPALRVGKVTVDAASNPEAWPFVLSADVGDTLSFTRAPIGGAEVTGSFIILSINVEFGRDKAEFTYVLTPSGVF